MNSSFFVMVYPIRLGSIFSDMISILLCVPTVSVHSDKLIGCGSFYTRAFISLRHLGRAGQAVPFTNPSKCIVMLQPQMEPKAAFKMESLKTKHSLEKEHTVFHRM